MFAFNQGVTFVVAIAWALFQLALPRFIILDSFSIRAIHLAFGLTLVFLSYPFAWHRSGLVAPELKKITWPNYICVLLSIMVALIMVFDREGLAARAGRPSSFDIVLGIILILVVLEASRRVIGWPLVAMALLFTLYAFVGPYMPMAFAFKGVSLNKYLNQVALSTEGIFGIPLDVAANMVFLFVMLGAMMEKAGTGLFFNDMSMALLGRYRGGPAKAAVVSSGLTGMVSGSSIANVVTTGTFTIPLMKKAGYPGVIAAATEVAASTNGQLMPPIMGAAAFIIAEYLAIPYLDVIRAAAIPAVASYAALFYITHLEACKRGMKGLPAKDLLSARAVFRKGFYHLLPLIVLVYELLVQRHSPQRAAFSAIVMLMGIILVRNACLFFARKQSLRESFEKALTTVASGMGNGSRCMLSVTMATATAGIVVGIVNMGIGSLIVHAVEVIAGGNIFILLGITAVASLLIGMGLPTTATYIVMASITVPIITELGVGAGFIIPAIAAHLFCFYFGILADDTPPVGLAAYAASAIAKSDPIRTGIQGFIYDLRTAIIPFMFVFNPELLLCGVRSPFQMLLIFTLAVIGCCAFANAMQGWFATKNKWYEIPVLLIIAFCVLNPKGASNLLGIPWQYRYFVSGAAVLLYALVYGWQRHRSHVPVS